MTDHHFQQFCSIWHSYCKCWCTPRRYLISNSLQHLCFWPTYYSQHFSSWLRWWQALIFINNDPLIASENMQTHITPWKMVFQVAIQSISVHTIFTLRHFPCPRVFLYGIFIPYSQTIKYLDLTLDQRLTWTHH